MVGNMDVLQKIYSYLRGDMSRQSFRDWIVEVQLNHESEIEKEASQVLAEIEGYYAEFSDDLIPESAWRKKLEALLRPEQPSTESSASILVLVIPSPTNVSWGSTQSSNFTPNPQPVMTSGTVAA